MHTKPIALDAYNQLAEKYSALAVEKAENAFIERPATLRILGEVAGLDVLDAGCGPGINARILSDRGAAVTGIDVSPKMLAQARQRCPETVRLIEADMAMPLDFLEDESFDRILSSLAIDYVRDWDGLFAEFRRVLVPGERFVFSVQHPTAAYNWYHPEKAVGVQLAAGVWTGFGEPIEVPDYYRSFSDMVNPLVRAGFLLECVEETQPVPECAARWPEAYEEYLRKPSFMVFSARKAV